MTESTGPSRDPVGDRPLTPAPSPTGGPVRVGVWVLHMALPVLGLWLLLARPELDVRWEHHPSHFWLVLSVAAVSVVLGIRVQEAARAHEDARLLLVGLAFIASAGFLFLHALATPRVLLAQSNGGFVLATPVGLAVAAVLVALSALDFSPSVAAAIVRRGGLLRRSLLGLMVVWAVVSLLGLPPLDAVPAQEEASGLFAVKAVASVGLYAFAAVRYFMIHRRRPSVMLVGVITAFALLAEAMVTVTVARNWQLSWWTWHILMTAGFGFVAYSAHVHYRREGSAAGLFNAIASERTVEEIRREYGSALESLTTALERSEASGLTDTEVSLLMAGLAARFGLSEGQTEVLGRAARALASERDQARRLATLAALGVETQVQAGEDQMLGRVMAAAGGGFGSDALRIGLLQDGKLVHDPRLQAGDFGREGERLELPLTIRGLPAGSLEVLRPAGSFEDRDRSLFSTLAHQLSIALENARLYEEVHTLFRQYMSPDVANALLADPRQAALGGAVVEVTALFADLRGFTSFSERSSPQRVVEMLNRYFGLAVPEILGNGGTVVQFVGDAVLAVFNVPARQADHALRAARTGLAMQQAIESVAGEHGWSRFRVGINTGPALAGNIGSDEMRSYNVMGDSINVAARLEAAAEPGTVLIGAETYEAIADVAEVEPVGPLELKGRESPVEAYRLLGLRR